MLLEAPFSEASPPTRLGGDIWKGVLFGGLVGGVSAFVGGILSAGALSYPLLGSKFLAAIAAGALQGTALGQNAPSGWSFASNGAFLTIPLGGVPNLMLNYGGIVLFQNVSIGLDKFGVVGYEDQLVFIFELIPFLGVALKAIENAPPSWYTDFKRGAHNALSTESLQPHHGMVYFCRL